MANWYEDDSFWEGVGRFLFSCFRTDEATAAEADQIIRLLHVKPGARILDLCCGRGRHSLEFARRGFSVTGVDRTEGYLETARSLAAKENLRIELIRQDMRSFRRSGFFDVALHLFSSFGYFEDSKEDLQVLRNLYDSLRPGGMLVMDMMGKEPTARSFEARSWYRHPDGSAFLLEERSILGAWEGVESRWTVIEGGQQKVFSFRVRLYSGAELKAALREAGFSDVTAYGSLEGTPYDQTAKRLVAVAVR